MEFPNLHNYNFDEKKKEDLIHVISVKFFEKIFNLIEDNKWVPALILSAILVSLVLILFKKICQGSFDSFTKLLGITF